MAGGGRVALVTGGTGFVGSHVVDELLTAGYRVRCLVRDTGRLRWLRDRSVELTEGDILGGGLAAAVAGVDVIFHFAGLTRGSSEELWRVNCEGTRALLHACPTGAAPAFVYCSSQAAAGPSPSDRPRTEADAPAPISDYGRSKLAAERELARREDMMVVVLRPAAVYGPRDRDTLTFFQMAARGLVPVPGLGRRRVQLVHVRDVASATRLACERPRAAGGTYFIAHPRSASWRELVAALAGALGRRVVPVPVPVPFIRVAGWIVDRLGDARPGRLDGRRARDLSVRAWTCRVDRALEELGWSPEMDLEEGFRETANWYRDRGWL